MINIEDDDYLDEDFTDYRFSELVAELERTGEILRQWDEGAPIVDGDNAPQTETKNQNYEKRETIQR